MRQAGPIKVLIVDDSAVVQAILTRTLAREPDLQIVGGARDPFEARELIIAHRPDVILLDIEMPRMDGLTFLSRLRVHYPVPVIMCSGAGGANSEAALRALELGAVDFVAKPSGGADATRLLCDELAEKIRGAMAARMQPTSAAGPEVTPPTSFRAARLDPNRYIVAVGASTGGTEAIKNLLSTVPPDFPPVAIVQHMPAGFTKSFAERLNDFSALEVREAVGDDLLEPGRAFVARGGVQMRVKRQAGRWRIEYGTDELVSRHCPSVDVLFHSVARCAGKWAAGIILTGMGADGAEGLLAMHGSGAVTIAQDQASCVVYGMPKVAVDCGAVQYAAAPAEVVNTLVHALWRRDACGLGARSCRSELRAGGAT